MDGLLISAAADEEYRLPVSNRTDDKGTGCEGKSGGVLECRVCRVEWHAGSEHDNKGMQKTSSFRVGTQ